MKFHELKCFPQYFRDLCSGRKQFEVRKDDRAFAVGDILFLREYKPMEKIYTGSHLLFEITYLCSLEPLLEANWVGLGVRRVMIVTYDSPNGNEL